MKESPKSAIHAMVEYICILKIYRIYMYIYVCIYIFYIYIYENFLIRGRDLQTNTRLRTQWVGEKRSFFLVPH